MAATSRIFAVLSSCCTNIFFSPSSMMLLLLLLLCSFTCETQGLMVPAMYVLGDSMLDVGNNNYLPHAFKANFHPYGIDFLGGRATGRYSNGKIPADLLAEKLGLPSPPPFLSLPNDSSAVGVFLKGISFASGGSGILNTTNKGHCLTFDDQIDLFSNVQSILVNHLGHNKTLKHLAESLFVIGIGNNDVIGYYAPHGSKTTTPKQFLGSLLSTLKGQLRRIYDLGARMIVFVGPVSIGCSPAQRLRSKNGRCIREENRGAFMLNMGVRALLHKSIKSELHDMSYSFVDGYASFVDYVQKPSTYGFVDVKTACCGGGKLNAEVVCCADIAYCSDRKSHVFWDANHPTEAVYRVFTDTIFDGAPPYVVPINVRKLVGLQHEGTAQM